MPNVSIAELARLHACESELQSMRETRHIEPFVECFAKNLGLMVANMSIARWPDWVQDCFRNAQSKYPIGAELYARRLEDVK